MKQLFSFVLVCCVLFGTLTLFSCGTQTADAITVISREDGSGTRTAFMDLLGITDITLAAEISQSTTVVMTSVENNRSAIGYISLGSLNDSIKALSIDGIAATSANVKNGTYPISRPFNIATKGELDDLTADFIAFMMSQEGQAVVEENGYIGSKDAQSYVPRELSGEIVITGSSSVKPVMEKLKEAYLEYNPSAKINIMQSDSGNGMSSVADGLCDIGMASRALKESELANGLTPTVIATDGIAVIVNRDCPISDLTRRQLAAIYTGEITQWSELQAP